MNAKPRFLTFLAIALFVLFGVAATHLTRTGGRNLKVFPSDISEQSLDSFMHSYNKALGVTCDFCHARDKAVFNGDLKFELDDNPLKEQARKMMRLTIQLNKEYFNYDTTKAPIYLNVVTCITCHRGNPMPIDIK
jgi:Photosynthetic reaction centre cytochrome C subunit